MPFVCDTFAVKATNAMKRKKVKKPRRRNNRVKRAVGRMSERVHPTMTVLMWQKGLFGSRYPVSEIWERCR